MAFSIIFNEDCLQTMERMASKNQKVNLIVTSPPYNTARNTINERAFKFHECRYDLPIDTKTDQEYIKWNVDIFNAFDKILKKDGCVLYNMSYSSEKPSLMYLVIAGIILKSPFMHIDTIIWKKKSALPNNRSPNKLTRIVEMVYVFARKSEEATFFMNKEVSSRHPRTNQAAYFNLYNFVEAKNNDGPTRGLNQATYSSELVHKLLDMYAPEEGCVYDPFNGTGSSGFACAERGLSYVGSELSPKQCEYSKERIEKTGQPVTLVMKKEEVSEGTDD